MFTRLRDLFESGGPILLPVALASLIGWAIAFHVAGRCLELARLARLARFARTDALASRFVGVAAAIAQRLRLLGALVSSLPLLGLLGTVLGMITTFASVRRDGAGDARSLAGGIREALIATESGLAAAIPALLAHQLLAAWLRTIQSRAARATEATR